MPDTENEHKDEHKENIPCYTEPDSERDMTENKKSHALSLNSTRTNQNFVLMRVQRNSISNDDEKTPVL